jgi:hypothetical protein
MGKYNGMVYVYDEEESLAHFGILGQKWGIRRFQNEDRTLTPEGKERYYGKSDSKQKKKNYERLVQINKETKNAYGYADSFRRRAREIFTDDQIKRIADARAQYKKDTKGLSENDHDNALADKIFTKPGGLNDVYSEVINEALGKYGHYNRLTGKGFSRRSLVQVLEDASSDYAKSNDEKLSKTSESEKTKMKDEKSQNNESKTDALIYKESNGSVRAMEYKKFDSKIDKKIRSEYKSDKEIKNDVDQMKAIFTGWGIDLDTAFGNGGIDKNSFNGKSESEKLYIMLQLAGSLGIMQIPDEMFD